MKPIERPISPAVVPDKRFGERPCPSCRKSIDKRAVFCTECKQIVAEAMTCTHCEEPRVPSDLEVCWKCGEKMRDEEKIDCPRCFSFRGYADQFPCQQCGFDPNATEIPGPGPAGAPILSVLHPPKPGADDPSRPDTTADEAAWRDAATIDAKAPAFDPVQCPICYSLVAPGAQCSVCDGVLEAR